MGSFKLRLVIYFMLLALLPLVAATVAFSEVAERGETGSADARLSTAIRVAQADFEDQIGGASETARSLARTTQVQEALRTGNRVDLLRLAGDVEHSSFYSADDELLAGEEPPRLAPFREVRVTADRKLVGKVTVYVPLDNALVSRLATRAALDDGDRFAFVSGGQVVAPSSNVLRGRLEVPYQGPRYIPVNGRSYRAVGTDLLAAEAARPAVSLVALSPKLAIDQAVGDLRSRFLLFSAVAMIAVGILAYTFGRTIVRSLAELAAAAAGIAKGRLDQRVPVRGRDEFAALGEAFNDMAAQLEQRMRELDAERARVRDAIARFGDALAATHDPYTLLPVIAQSIVEATGAVGARLVVNGKEIAREGDPAAGGRPLEIPLGLDGRETGALYLTPKEADFSDEARELAHWLGSQASVALENARLHRLVERQAHTDGLTELPNRRHFEEALEAEISRAERFESGLALILADLDDFKQVNDRYGHQAGDEVLQTFADILRTTVREIDLPARYGGEEFAVLLPQTDLDGAHQLAERLRRALAAKPMATHPGGLVAVTASFGVAAFPDAPTSAALFASADEALYRAKRAGKNCVVSADAGSVVRAPD